jgi:PRTRC genetic system ThiF family protein
MTKQDAKKADVIPFPELDTSYADAATVVPRQLGSVKLLLVGAGGSGSWTAPHVCRLAAILEHELNIRARVYIIDDDRVESGNVPRSNFTYAEVGQPKALTLAKRFAAAWGINVTAVIKKFRRNMIWLDSAGEPQLTIIIGCVDNYKARLEMHRALKDAKDADGEISNTWWLDAGNDLNTGQVLLGNAYALCQLRGCFPCSTMCQSLPSPALQFPDLIKPPETAAPRRDLSCRQLMLLNEQSLVVNQRVASEIGDFLMRLLLTNDLQRFATYFNLHAGTTTSSYVTPEVVARAVGRNVDLINETKTLRRRRSTWRYSYLEEAA